MNRYNTGLYLLKSRPNCDGMCQDPTEAAPAKSYSQQLTDLAKSIRADGVAQIIKSQMSFDFSAPKHVEERTASNGKRLIEAIFYYKHANQTAKTRFQPLSFGGIYGGISNQIPINYI